MASQQFIVELQYPQIPISLHFHEDISSKISTVGALVVSFEAIVVVSKELVVVFAELVVVLFDVIVERKESRRRTRIFFFILIYLFVTIENKHLYMYICIEKKNDLSTIFS